MVYSVISRPEAPSQSGTPSNMSIDPAVAAARKSIIDLTEGRAKDLANDPYQTAALDYMKGSVAGQNVPFTNTVKNSILAQQGAGAADAEKAQMEALRQSLGASGGSIYDPGYQAAQREAMSQRQGANLDAQGKLEAQAGIANNQAQAAAANSLSSARAQQNSQINQMNLAGADYRSRTTAAVPTASGVAGFMSRPAGIQIPGFSQNSMTAQNQAAMRL